MSGSEQFEETLNSRVGYINLSEYQDIRSRYHDEFEQWDDPPAFRDNFSDTRDRARDLLDSTSRSFLSRSEYELKRQVGSGVAIVSVFAENLLVHPFLVLRRQCQVNHNSSRYHLQPFTLLPTIYRLHRHQGFTPLWKGLGSTLLVRGLSLGIEDLISRTTPWPKEIDHTSTTTEFVQHVLLKCVSLALVTPFYSASFVETVQSDIASETPGFLDVFREGFGRLLHWGRPTRVRMLPIWALVVPTVSVGIIKYMFFLSTKGITKHILLHLFRQKFSPGDRFPDDFIRKQDALIQEMEINAHIIATMVSDIAFYPCETVLHRLHLQGTRTIIDNLDNGKTVLPILTGYTNPMDCYNLCIHEEGTAGLYKGFGALILQYVAYFALVKVSRMVLYNVGTWMRNEEKEAELEALLEETSPVISNVTSTNQSYLIP